MAIKFEASTEIPEDLFSGSSLQYVGPARGTKPAKETRLSSKMSPDKAADLVSFFESGNRNLKNYRFDPTHTASGYFQITDSNWKNNAPLAGVDLEKYPTALSAPYDVQKQVFNRMYLDKGFEPWASFNPRLAAALGGDFKAPKWIPTPEAISSEQGRDSVDVRHMSPKDYLSLLPPIEQDDSNSIKQKSLLQSLNKGEGIHSIPSLDVTPRGSDIHVLDFDGRNRAQAAADEGLESIPVSVRGIEPGKQYSNIKGLTDKTLKYDFPSLPRITPTPAELAKDLAPPIGGGTVTGPNQVPVELQSPSVPLSRADLIGENQKVFEGGGPGAPPAGTPIPQVTPADRALTAKYSEPMLALPGVPGMPQSLAELLRSSQAPTVTGKPDFYPQIAAGINRDIISPSSFAYRGINPPLPTDVATTTNRLALANQQSAGQVGLPSPPANSIWNFINNLSPIASAQAAETSMPPSPPGMVTPNPQNLNPIVPSSNIQIPFDANATVPTNILNEPTQPAVQFKSSAPIPESVNPPPYGFTKHLSSMLARDAPTGPLTIGLEDIVPPVANVATYPIRAPLADIYSFLTTKSGDKWEAERNRLLQQTEFPETAMGHLISDAINLPGVGIQYGAGKIADLMDLSPEARALFRRGTEVATDFLPPLAGVASRVAAPGVVSSIATAPARRILESAISTPEMKAAKLFNKTQPEELAVGGMPATQLARELDESRSLGIPTTLADLARRGGPQENLLNRMLAGSPVAAAKATDFLENRRIGQRLTPDTEPVGGALERMSGQAESTFGPGSSWKASKNLNSTISKANSILELERESLDKLRGQIDATEHILKSKGLNPRTNPNVIDMKLQKSRIESRIRKLSNDIDRATENLNAVNFGRSLLNKNVPLDKVVDYVKRMKSPEAEKYLKMSLGDAIRTEFRNARKLGVEPYTIFSPENVRNKISTVLKTDANKYLRTVDLEERASGQELKTDLNAAIENRRRNMLYRFGEAALHSAVPLIAGMGGTYASYKYGSPIGDALFGFWGLRGARNLLEYMHRGGSFVRPSTREAIGNLFYNPNVKLNTMGRDTVPVTRSAASQDTINNLAKILTGGGYLTTVPAQQPAAPDLP